MVVETVKVEVEKEMLMEGIYKVGVMEMVAGETCTRRAVVEKVKEEVKEGICKQKEVGKTEIVAEVTCTRKVVVETVKVEVGKEMVVEEICTHKVVVEVEKETMEVGIYTHTVVDVMGMEAEVPCKHREEAEILKVEEGIYPNKEELEMMVVVTCREMEVRLTAAVVRRTGMADDPCTLAMMVVADHFAIHIALYLSRAVPLNHKMCCSHRSYCRCCNHMPKLYLQSSKNPMQMQREAMASNSLGFSL